jgi:hypothetical protein
MSRTLIKYATMKEMVDRVEPDTFITLSVKQSLPAGLGPHFVGNHERYDRVMAQTLKKVGGKIHGKRKSRRKGHLIKNISTLERGMDGRWHIHCCLKRPSHVNIEKFREIFLECWEKSRWYLPIHDFQEIDGGAPIYIMKTGQDSLLTESLYI